MICVWRVKGMSVSNYQYNGAKKLHDQPQQLYAVIDVYFKM